jgi:putative membrane protein
MERRTLLLALLATATIPAIAHGASEKMGTAEMKHAEQTLTVGSVALDTSKVAQQKAQNAWVKKFANYEVAEQTTIAEILKQMGAAPGKPSEKHVAMLKKLQSASGPAFDAEYVSGQIEGHTELLKIQEDYIAAGKDVHHLATAKLARGQIKEHIDLLQTIQKELKS